MSSGSDPLGIVGTTIEGKYRIVRCIGDGGFARVYEALDKIEGTHVAIKVPRAEFVTEANLEAFRREVRTHATLDHPNILPIKNADLVGDVFVIAVSLGKGSLADRMRKRMSMETFLAYARQMLAAVAHAHRAHVVHCDVKPENFLVFGDSRVRLADFGIAKIAQRTLKGSGSGTIGYIAPEQAMGKPSFRSDVFSLGLILWEMLTGELPEYPFDLLEIVANSGLFVPQSVRPVLAQQQFEQGFQIVAHLRLIIDGTLQLLLTESFGKGLHLQTDVLVLAFR